MHPVIEYHKALRSMATDPCVAILLVSWVDKENYRGFVKVPSLVSSCVEEVLNRIHDNNVDEKLNGATLALLQYITSDGFRSNRLIGEDMVAIFKNLKVLVLNDQVINHHMDDKSLEDLIVSIDHAIDVYCGNIAA